MPTVTKERTIADCLDDAHGAVSEALGMLYKRHREAKYSWEQAHWAAGTDSLREITTTLERLGDLYDTVVDGNLMETA